METSSSHTSEVTAQASTAITTPAARLTSSSLDGIEFEQQNANGQRGTLKRVQKRAAETQARAFGREVQQ